MTCRGVNESLQIQLVDAPAIRPRDRGAAPDRFVVGCGGIERRELDRLALDDVPELVQRQPADGVVITFGVRGVNSASAVRVPNRRDRSTSVAVIGSSDRVTLL